MHRTAIPRWNPSHFIKERSTSDPIKEPPLYQHSLWMDPSLVPVWSSSCLVKEQAARWSFARNRWWKRRRKNQNTSSENLLERNDTQKKFTKRRTLLEVGALSVSVPDFLLVILQDSYFLHVITPLRKLCFLFKLGPIALQHKKISAITHMSNTIDSLEI